ncbi:hypothetical protein V3C99_012652 [Haemonchus contortus]
MVKNQRRNQKKISSKDSCLDAPADVISAELPRGQEQQLELDKISAADLLRTIIERNKDPLLEPLLIALSDKIPREFSESINSEKKARSIVVYGLEEAGAELRPSERQKDRRRRSLRFSMR